MINQNFSLTPGGKKLTRYPDLCDPPSATPQPPSHPLQCSVPQRRTLENVFEWHFMINGYMVEKLFSLKKKKKWEKGKHCKQKNASREESPKELCGPISCPSSLSLFMSYKKNYLSHWRGNAPSNIKSQKGVEYCRGGRGGNEKSSQSGKLLCTYTLMFLSQHLCFCSSICRYCIFNNKIGIPLYPKICTWVGIDFICT